MFPTRPQITCVLYVRLYLNVSVFVGLEEPKLRQQGQMLAAPHFGEGRATRLETSHHPDG